MLSDNLLWLRKYRHLTQEQVAGEIGVSRQALSKWETGESAPDIENCVALAAFYDVTLDDLVRYNEKKEVLPIPPKGKYFFGTVTLGPQGELQLPQKAMEVFSLEPGEKLLVLGEEGSGIAMTKKEGFFAKIKG